MLKFLDGWKSWIVATVFLANEISRGVGGPDFGDKACTVAGAFGASCTDLPFNPVATASALFALWAVGDHFWKAVKQSRAGVPLAQLHTTAGYVELAGAEDQRRAAAGLPPKRPII